MRNLIPYFIDNCTNEHVNISERYAIKQYVNIVISFFIRVCDSGDNNIVVKDYILYQNHPGNV